jgi:hypothetical protein
MGARFGHCRHSTARTGHSSSQWLPRKLGGTCCADGQAASPGEAKRGEARPAWRWAVRAAVVAESATGAGDL